MKNTLYGTICEKDGQKFLDYGGDYLLPYSGEEPTGAVVEYPLEVPAQEWESVYQEIEEEKNRQAWLRSIGQQPFEVRLIQTPGLVEGLRRKKAQDHNKMPLEHEGMDITFYTGKHLPGDLLSRLFEGKAILVRLADNFDPSRHCPGQLVTVFPVLQSSRQLEEYDVVPMFVEWWSKDGVGISRQEITGLIQPHYFSDFQEKMESGYFHEGQEIWVRLMKDQGDNKFLCTPCDKRLATAENKHDTSVLEIAPDTVIGPEDACISYVDWGAKRLMVHFEGFDIPVKAPNIPGWPQRIYNFYRYMAGEPVSVRVLTWAPRVEDCLFELLPDCLHVNYPFQKGDILEGEMKNGYFTVPTPTGKYYQLFVAPWDIKRSQEPYRKWMRGQTFKARLDVKQVSQFGDVILGFTSYMEKEAAKIPEGTLVHAQVIGYQENMLLWRLAYLFSSVPVTPEQMEQYPVGCMVSLTKTSGGFSLMEKAVYPVPTGMEERKSDSGPLVPQEPLPFASKVVRANVLSVSRDIIRLKYKDYEGILNKEDWQWSYVYTLEGLAQTGEELEVKVLPEVGMDGTLRFSRKAILSRPNLRPKKDTEVDVTVECVGKHLLSVLMDGVILQIHPSQACWTPEYALESLDLRKEFRSGDSLKALIIATGAHTADIRLSLLPYRFNPWDFVPSDKEGTYRGTVFSCDENGLCIRIRFYYGWVPNPGFYLAPGTAVYVKQRRLNREKGTLELVFKDLCWDSASEPKKPAVGQVFPFRKGDDVRLKICNVFSAALGDSTEEGLEVEAMKPPRIRGFIPKRELAWRNSEQQVASYRPGQVVTARIIALDAFHDTFKASLRDLIPDDRTLEEINVGEKLDVVISKYKSQNYNLTVQYGTFKGKLDLNNSYWFQFDHASFFIKGRTLEATVKTVNPQKGEIYFHLPEYEDFSCWKSLDLQAGEQIDVQVVRTSPEKLFVRYRQFLAQMDIGQLSWTRHLPLEDIYSEGEFLHARILAVRNEIRQLELDAKPVFNPFAQNDGLKEGDAVDAEFISNQYDGIHVMVGTCACLLPLEQLPDGVSILPDLAVGELLPLRVFSVNPVEKDIILTAKNAASVFRSFHPGEYDLFTVSGYTDTGDVLLHCGPYPAILKAEYTCPGLFSLEEVFPKGEEVYLRIESVDPPMLQLSLRYEAADGPLPTTPFLAEICLKHPEEGIILRYRDSFCRLPAQTFSQPMDSLLAETRKSLMVRADGSAQNRLPCVTLEDNPVSPAFSDAITGHVLIARCVRILGDRTLLEAQGYYLTLSSSDQVSPIRVSAGDTVKVRVLYSDPLRKRFFVSPHAVKNDPLLSIKPHIGYRGIVQEEGGQRFFMVDIHGCGTIRGEIQGDVPCGPLQAYPVAICQEYPRLNMPRKVVFAESRANRPIIGQQVRCTWKMPIDWEKSFIEGQFTFKGQTFETRLPMEDRYWSDFPNKRRPFPNAVIMGLPEKEGDPYSVSVKHTSENPLSCLEVGDAVPAMVFPNLLPKGFQVLFYNTIGFVNRDEISHQVVDLPEEFLRCHREMNLRIVSILPTSQERKYVSFQLSRKALYDNPFQGEDGIRVGNTYPALVQRIDSGQQMVVVKLGDLEAEATILENESFIVNMSTRLPQPGEHIQRVRITRIEDENGLPHVFAEVEKR